LISGLKPNNVTMLLPKDAATGEASGVRSAAEGTAWMVAPEAGEYLLVYSGGSRAISGAGSGAVRLN
jgi:hypothetical protein